MKRRSPHSRRYIDPQAFKDLRIYSGMTREQVAKALDVTARTVQNWETGGARIPWMAFRMLRILLGFALPGQDWEGWTLHKGQLYSPTGRNFDPVHLANIQHIFDQARLWRQMYAKHNKPKLRAMVLPFPDWALQQEPVEPETKTVNQKGGKR